MKSVLITGMNSYIGNSFESYVKKVKSDSIKITKISLRNNDWKSTNFSNYDTVLHVAGIAHVSTNKKLESLYYNVNSELTYEFAKKVKKDGIRKFIFLSSIIVYGNGEGGVIYDNTEVNPKDFYSKSKVLAERKLISLEDENFKVTIVRTPIVYGKNAKGNFDKLVKLSLALPVFPSYNNMRSFIYVKNLSKYLMSEVLHFDNESNIKNYCINTSTNEIVKQVRKVYNKRTMSVSIFNPLIKLLSSNNYFGKIFGDNYFNNLGEFKGDYDLNSSLLDYLIEEENL